MSDSVKPGDSVEWTSSGGTSVGKVKKKLTAPIEIKGHHVAASADNPEYLVQSDKTGAQAAHKPSSLKKSAAAGAGSKAPAKKSATKTSPRKSGASGGKAAAKSVAAKTASKKR